jgi:hypothetical protein
MPVAAMDIAELDVGLESVNLDPLSPEVSLVIWLNFGGEHVASAISIRSLF